MKKDIHYFAKKHGFGLPGLTWPEGEGVDPNSSMDAGTLNEYMRKHDGHDLTCTATSWLTHTTTRKKYRMYSLMCFHCSGVQDAILADDPEYQEWISKE